MIRPTSKEKRENLKETSPLEEPKRKREKKRLPFNRHATNGGLAAQALQTGPDKLDLPERNKKPDTVVGVSGLSDLLCGIAPTTKQTS